MTGLQHLRLCLPKLILSLNRHSFIYPVFQPVESDVLELALDYLNDLTRRQMA